MALAINGHGDLRYVRWNGRPLSRVYFNGLLVWPDISWYMYYKYIRLEHIVESGVNEITYELHISKKKLDDTYKRAIIDGELPDWQYAQPDVVGPDGQPYASPLAFVRRVVIDNIITPVKLKNWFAHLYGGLNNVESVAEKYPCEMIGLDKIYLDGLTSLNSTFAQCHASEIDISSWEINHITDMTEMFRNSSVKHIYVNRSWNTQQVTHSEKMFFNCMYLHNYESQWQDKTKAIIDNGRNGGYLETK